MTHIITNIISPICFLLGLATTVFTLFIMLTTIDLDYQKYYWVGSWLIPIIIGRYLIKKYNLINSSPMFYLGPISVGVLLGLVFAEATRFILIRE